MSQQDLIRPDLLWYKDAIIYELHIRAFYDSNSDGIGDFPGLTQKLDYLQELGVTALWLLPFYPSPLRDDGYDVADYQNVHPAYGTLDDFQRFMQVAHARGLRVITELVANHTSDQHPWFQAARRAKLGSPARVSMSGATQTSAMLAHRLFSETSRPRTGPGTRWRGPTTGIAFSPNSLTSTTPIPSS